MTEIPAARPLSPAREAKFRAVISRRQNTLTVILENIHDPHNISAILRTCDAVGIQEVQVINSIGPFKVKLGKRSSASARKWVRTNTFKTAEECAKDLKERGFKIYATHLSADAETVYDLNLYQPVALAFGNEHRGVSDELLQFADGNFIIPMMGMIPSLNVSVACAVSLYEALRQRLAHGLYDTPRLNETEQEEMYASWSNK